MSSEEINAFTRLAIEHERTLFMFYGFDEADTGEVGAGYFKLAHSLSEALDDLVGNPAVVEQPYFVTDAFVEAGEEAGGATVHVELVSLRKIIEAHGEAM